MNRVKVYDRETRRLVFFRDGISNSPSDFETLQQFVKRHRDVLVVIEYRPRHPSEA